MTSSSANQQKSIRNWLTRARKTWQDANTLYQHGGTYASVIDLAYYSMMYAALASLETSGKIKFSDESRVITLFDQKSIKQNNFSKEMGKTLRYVYDLHLANEREIYFAVDREQAIESLTSSAKFADVIEQKLIEEKTI